MAEFLITWSTGKKELQVQSDCVGVEALAMMRWGRSATEVRELYNIQIDLVPDGTFAAGKMPEISENPPPQEPPPQEPPPQEPPPQEPPPEPDSENAEGEGESDGVDAGGTGAAPEEPAPTKKTASKKK